MKRLPGKRVVAVLISLIALVFATAVTIFWLNREPSGEILAMRAVDRDRAILLRRGFEARDTVHVALHDASGRHVWSEALFGAQSGGVPFVADESVVVPALAASRRPATHVFRLADGRFVFRAEPPPASVPSQARARYASAGGVLFELYPGDPGILSAYELGSGRRLESVRAPAGAEGIELVDGALVFTGAVTSAIDPATLERTSMPSASAPRTVRARAVGLRDDCLVWEGPDGPASIPASALGEGRASIIDGEGATVLRVEASGSEVVLAAIDDEGVLHVARVRPEEDGAVVESLPEHLAGGAIFLRSARQLVGLRMPELSAPASAEAGFEVSSETRAPSGCGSVSVR